MKVIQFIKWLVKLPTFWMPAKWKGVRRIIITALLAVCAFLQGLNLVDIAGGICQVYTQLTGAACDLTTLATAVVAYVGLLYEALKDEGDVSVFNFFAKAEK